MQKDIKHKFNKDKTDFFDEKTDPFHVKLTNLMVSTPLGKSEIT